MVKRLAHRKERKMSTKSTIIVMLLCSAILMMFVGIGTLITIAFIGFYISTDMTVGIAGFTFLAAVCMVVCAATVDDYFKLE